MTEIMFESANLLKNERVHNLVIKQSARVTLLRRPFRPLL